MLTEIGLIIQAALDVVMELLPSVAGGSTSAVAKIIALLDKILPTVLAALPNMVASIKDIISALQSTGPLTDAQMTALETMSATLDAALVQAGKDEGLTDPLAPKPAA